jgi:hypothetical protein
MDDVTRDYLGVSYGQAYEFQIRPSRWCGELRWALGATEIGYRISSRLAVLSVLLGCLGLLLAAFPDWGGMLSHRRGDRASDQRWNEGALTVVHSEIDLSEPKPARKDIFDTLQRIDAALTFDVQNNTGVDITISRRSQIMARLISTKALEPGKATLSLPSDNYLIPARQRVRLELTVHIPGDMIEGETKKQSFQKAYSDVDAFVIFDPTTRCEIVVPRP